MLSKTKEVKSTRAAFGEALVELGAQNPNIVALDADLSCSTQTKMFGDKYPDRFFNMGISEQDMMGTAVGLATCGKIPFVATFAMFASGRAWDQVRNGICYPRFNVKIIATHGGITVGEDGASHQALEDVSIMRSIPNMVVLSPADATETKAAVKWAAEYQGPVYIRITRTSMETIFDEQSYVFDTKAKIIKEGKDVTLISTGETLIEAYNAAGILSEQGIDAEVISVPVIKPLDCDTIISSAKKTNKVVTLENHSIIGGLGSAVCECLSENYPVKIKRLGTNDVFGQSGHYKELMAEYELTAQKVAPKIAEFLKK
ncbi:MAG: transketolase family protein [Candidatus Gastranaerophilales bacterium]|nr:transketolase family protein [Candidatus Gastranaerophilales bacterium]